MKLSEALEQFLEARTAAGLKATTLVWYRRRVGRFVSWADDLALEAVGVGTVRGFLASLRAQSQLYQSHTYKHPQAGGLSPLTIRGYGRALRQFFNFLAGEGLTGGNLMARIQLPKNGKPAPKGIPFEDVQRLLKSVEGSDSTERDRALVLFLTDTGCRVGGLIGLTWADVDLKRRVAFVTEKGDKTRPVFFSEGTREALLAWRGIWQEWDWAGDWVFPSHNTGEQLTVSGVNQVLKRLKKRAGVTGRANPHSFRHGFAKDYLMAGGDLASLADLMGHESVETTKSFYAVFEQDDLRRKHDEFCAVRCGKSVQSYR